MFGQFFHCETDQKLISSTWINRKYPTLNIDFVLHVYAFMISISILMVSLLFFPYEEAVCVIVIIPMSLELELIQCNIFGANTDIRE